MASRARSAVMSQLPSQGFSGVSTSSSNLHRSGLHNLTALIVDDNSHMTRLLHTLLAAYGLRDVHEASDGRSGIKVLNEVDAELVIRNYDRKPVNGIVFI